MIARKLALLVFAVAPVLLAQNNRSVVSVSGLDTNACTAIAPCRSFSVALGKTNVGGEVVATNSGGFGGFSVNGDVTVEGAPGVYAGVTVTMGTAINVVSGSVALRNLVINGLGTGQTGIQTQVQNLDVENCTIENFTQFGINSFNNVRVSDSIFRNLNTGVWLDNPVLTIHATVVNTQIMDSTGGIAAVRGATVTARNVVVTHTISSAFTAASTGSVMSMDSCVATNCGFGATVGTGATLRVGNSLITGNGIGIDATALTWESWGDNEIRGNTTDTKGTKIPIAMQ